MSTEMKVIYAKKGTQFTIFSEIIWREMGSDKNGWEEITKAQYSAKAATEKKPADVGNEKEYRELYERGKGFEKDGDYVRAAEEYRKAYDKKPNASLKGKLNKMNNLIEEDANREELIEMGDTAKESKDYEGALEAYEAAQEIRETEEVTELIKEIKML